MNKATEKIINHTKTRLGLHDYYLHNYSFNRKLNFEKKTFYTITMEWYPTQITKIEEDLNPKGTAVVEVDLTTNKFLSIIFVKGKTYAKQSIELLSEEAIIEWVELETGLVYHKQFVLHRYKGGEYQFAECVDGIPISPTGLIEIKVNQKGQLLFFSANAHFPAYELIREEPFSLTLDKIEPITMEQTKLIEFPLYEQQKLVPLYAIEEIYVRNNGTQTIPLEIDNYSAKVEMNKLMEWDKPLDEPFERKEVNITEEITEEMAYKGEQARESFPISERDIEYCMQAVLDFLRKKFPHDSGVWKLKSLQRDKNYLLATLLAMKEKEIVFKRKMKVFIHSETYTVENYLDSSEWISSINKFARTGEVVVSKQEAYEKLKASVQLKPHYVYDKAENQFVLCGKLDSDYGVNATDGKVLLLEEL
ncbi:hypothetical protein [Bacillus kwashiorkori]|uniref:hypothetical protein n=1 Tax=Bacillus kwashiorkori TaxID=1522318 RepID=UPI0007866905|nr:hypothetical protein [Bacillus kwashiorkori]